MFDYRWFKVGADIFNDTKIKIIEADEEADTIICIWFKALSLAGIVNDSGYLYINEETPYTLKTLAIEFNRPLEKVKAAMKVLRKLQMIEFTEDKFYKVKNWTKYQNVDALEKQRAETSKRVAKHRAKKKIEKEENKNSNGNDNVLDDKSGQDDDGLLASSNNCGHSDNDLESYNNTLDKSCSDDMSSLKKNSVLSEICNENLVHSKDKPNIDEDIINSHNDPNNNKDKITDTNDNVINKKEHLKGNVTCNADNSQDNIDCNNEVTSNNVTVTDKIKSETKSQIKTEKKTEGERENDLSFKLSELCVKLTKHYESITGKVGGLDYGKLRLAISIHGEEYVRMAIDKAIESGKSDFNYINGILKNWKREGYPNEKEEVKVNGGKCNIKGNTADKNEFAGFKPKKPKQLTEEQRKKIEADLI